MSFLSELFHGRLDWGNLAPGNIFKDTASSFANQPEWAKIAEIALPAIALGGVGLGALADPLAAGAAAEGGLGAAEAAGAGAGAAFADPTEAALFAGAAGDPTAVALAGAGAIPEGSAALPEAATLTSGVVDPATVTSPNLTLAAQGGDIPSVAQFGGLDPGTTPVPSWMTTPGGGSFTGGDFAATTGGAPGGGATVADAANVFGPGPSVFQTGAPATPFAGATGGAVPAGAAGAEGPGVLSSIGSALKSAAPWAGAAGLGYNLFQGYQSQQALKQLQQQETDYQNKIAQAGQASLTAAQPLLAAGQALTTGGPIPAGMQAILDNYRNAQRARVIQSYTSQGLSGDPNKNTSLMQDLNAVDNQMLALQESIGTQMITTANQMLTSGASATQIAAELPMMMQRLDIALQQQTGNAIANFAAAMSGGTMKVAGQGTGGINLNLNTGTNTTTQSLLGAQ